jgi:hypothetical protein
MRDLSTVDTTSFKDLVTIVHGLTDSVLNRSEDLPV